MPVPSLTPREVENLRAETANKVVLLDIREPWECERVRLPGCLHIPMDELTGRLGELNPEQPYVVLCHHGNRSLQVAAFLQSRGFKHVINLAGGIDDWALSLDPGLPRY
ncbi:MAG: rhodanese-like domain-containing protein [Gammaproteobacteria bacterium]